MRKKIDQKARQRWYFYTIYIRVGGDGSVLYEKERVLSGGEGSLREREVKRCLASPGNKITLKYFFARFSRQLFFFFFIKTIFTSVIHFPFFGFSYCFFLYQSHSSLMESSRWGEGKCRESALLSSHFLRQMVYVWFVAYRWNRTSYMHAQQKAILWKIYYDKIFLC